MVARGTLVSAVGIPLAATMAVATTAAMAGTVVTAGRAVTDGEADIGAIRATVGAGDGDTLMATSTVLRITHPTPTTIRRIALRAPGVPPMGTTTLRRQIPPRNPEATSRSLGDRRQERRARTIRFALSPRWRRVLRLCRLTR